MQVYDTSGTTDNGTVSPTMVVVVRSDSIDEADELAILEAAPFTEFWECFEESRYLHPQMVPQLAPRPRAHRPREDIRCADGGRAW